MGKGIQAVRGMKDYLPGAMAQTHFLESCLRKLACQYAYEEIRTPTVESTDLFKRSIGDVTDIVEKEMYSFEDRNGDSLTLRPEGTACVVRAGIEHGLLYNQTQKLWYLGPMFRHERPQKGRYRQFYQFGLEAYGFAGPMADAEMILFSARLWKMLGIEQDVRLEINTLGGADERAAYRDILVAYFKEHENELDEDSVRRLDKNPLRILDTKNPAMKALVAGAPKLIDHLSDESKERFEQFKAILDDNKIAYTINPNLVRGLDYYCHTVFEWITDSLGAQGTVCAGGRYDGLVEQLGGKATPAVGFAMGIERLALMLEQLSPDRASEEQVDVFFIAIGEAAERAASVIAEDLRDAVPGLNIAVNLAGGGLKNQFKKADKSGANIALVLGDEELAAGQVNVKYLREHKDQEQVNIVDLVAYILSSRA